MAHAHDRRLAAECSALRASSPITLSSSSANPHPSFLRAGIIGLDTTDAVTITTALSASSQCRVVVAVRRGTGAAMSTNSLINNGNHRIIRSSGDQIFPNTQLMRAAGVLIVDTVAELLEMVDCVLYKTGNSRRPTPSGAGIPGAPRREAAVYGQARRCEPRGCTASLYWPSTRSLRGSVCRSAAPLRCVFQLVLSLHVRGSMETSRGRTYTGRTYSGA